MLKDRLKFDAIWKNELLEIVSLLNYYEITFLKVVYEHSEKTKPISINSSVFKSFESKNLCIASLSRKGVLEDVSIQEAKDSFLVGSSKLVKNDELIVITELGYEIIRFMLSTQKNLKDSFSNSIND